jgi:periplasmic copper chaperone A
MHVRPSGLRARPAGARGAAIRAMLLHGALLAVAACGESPLPRAAAITPPEAPANSGFALVLEEAWVEPAPAGSPTHAYLCISSDATVPIAVGAVATRIAQSVRLAGIVAAPGPLAERGGFIIPAHGSIRMHPGGTWLQLAPLQVALNTGDRVRFALAMPGEFTMWVEAEVRSLTVAAIPSQSSRRS